LDMARTSMQDIDLLHKYKVLGLETDETGGRKI
jgi:hypothetical protein